MIESGLKTILTVLLLMSLSIYLVIAEILPLLGYFTSSNILFLFKIAGLLVSIFTVTISMKSKLLAKLLLGKRYIAGKYTGKSYYIDDNDANVLEYHIEEFEVIQSVLVTEIAGRSLESNGEFYSSWNGRLVQSTNESHYVFLGRIRTPDRDYSYDIMEFQFRDQDNLDGFFIVAGASKNGWKFSATRVTS